MQVKVALKVALKVSVQLSSGRSLTTTANFSSFAGEHAGAGVNIASTAASSMGWGAGAEPIGWSLLRKMGWCEGDPVGKPCFH